jgi:ABC-type Fe3+/spermidine/putrescine transport system ATPase subunit
MHGIELQSVSKRYGDVAAVDDISFAIKPAEFLTLLGPSGCGKTTTLRIVAGLQEPDCGRIRIADQDVTALSPSARNIGMVFQSLALFPHMTVAENVAFGLKMRRIAKTKIAERVERTLAIVCLQALANRYPLQLSGGEQQRVALARALIIEPSILVLDEPFASLDRKLREAMQQELRAITRELQITTLFVTHDQEEALMLSDWVAVMNRGRIEQFGTSRDIFWRPETRFVAEFMGLTNFLRARVLSANGKAVELSLLGVTFACPFTGKVESGDEIEMVVRPEWIDLSRAAPTANSGIQGRLVDAAFHGSISSFTVQLDAGVSLTVRKKNDISEAASGVQFLIGESIWVSWPPEAMQMLAA